MNLSRALVAGCGFGIASALLSHATVALGLHLEPWAQIVTPLLNAALLIGFVLWGLAATRDRAGYGTQVALGLLVAMIGGAVLAVDQLVLFDALHPDYRAEMIAFQAEALERQGRTARQIEATMADLERVSTPVARALVSFVFTLVIGLLVSLLAAVFYRRGAR